MSGDLAGLLLVDKAEGPSSHDIVVLARKAVRFRRIGHTGTLDPFASGLMLLCVGWVTRLAEYLASLPKVYRGVIRLGVRTDTDDCTGSAVETHEGWGNLERHQIQAALEEQLGEIEQTPPTYSAKKSAGRRAYQVARAGSVPELASQPVTIHRLRIREFALPDVGIELECSSGTYVRAVARDLGASLGVGAHLAALRRLRVGGFSVEDAIPLTGESRRDDIVERLLPPEAAVAHLERVDVDDASFNELIHGRSLAWQGSPSAGPIAVHNDGRLAAVAGVRHDRLWPMKVFATCDGPKGGPD